MSKKVIIIVGPTASGKTGIGVRLAKELNGEIVSADSRQIYRGLDIGSGKEYFDDVKQWLIDIIEPPLFRCVDTTTHPMCGKSTHRNEKGHLEKRYFSVFDWLELAKAAIDDIFSRGKVPIVVGGTGLYVQALVEGFELEQNPKSKWFDHAHQSCQMSNNKDVIARSGASDKAISEKSGSRIPDAYGYGAGESGMAYGEIASLQHHIARNDDTKEQYDNLTVEQLKDLLKKLDPIAYEKIDLNNPHRIIRAIERAEQGLKPTKIKPDFEVLQIGIDLPRAELYKRIDDRVERRFDQGMLEEIIGLIKSGVDTDWLQKLGLEYRIITEFILENSDFPICHPKLTLCCHPELTVGHPVLDTGSNNSLSVDSRRSLPRTVIRGGNDNKENGNDKKGSWISQKDEIKKIADQLKTLNEYQVMKQQLKYRIHAFARRQLTWFRRFPEIRRLSDYRSIKKEVERYL